MKKYISLQEAADMADVTRQTISNWANAGILAKRKKKCSSGYKYEVSIESLMNIINETTIKQSEDAIKKYEADLLRKSTQLQKQWETLLLTEQAVCRYPEVRRTIINVLLAVVNSNNNLRGIEMILHLVRGCTYEEVATKFCITRERVRQIVNRTYIRCNHIFAWSKVAQANQALTNEVQQLQQQLKQLEAENYNLRKDKEELLISQKIEENIINEKNEDLINLYATSIKDTDLPTRVKLLLQCGKIYTVRDLLHKDKLELLRLRNFGRKALIIVDMWLEDNNLEMGQLKRKY